MSMKIRILIPTLYCPIQSKPPLPHETPLLCKGVCVPPHSRLPEGPACSPYARRRAPQLLPGPRTPPPIKASGSPPVAEHASGGSLDKRGWCACSKLRRKPPIAAWAEKPCYDQQRLVHPGGGPSRRWHCQQEGKRAERPAEPGASNCPSSSGRSGTRQMVVWSFQT